MDKSILYKLSYGLYAIGVKGGACIVNTVFQITSSPMTIALSMNKNNNTHSLIVNSGRFSVSVLNEGVPSEIIKKLGYTCSKDTDKFTGLPWKDRDGLPILTQGAGGYLICRVTGSSDLDTHTVFYAEVEDAFEGENGQVMTYEYYHKVIKGAAPQNAPTYQETVTEQEGYVCTVCGYVYQGELTEDFTCPVCGVPVKMFKKA